MTHMFMYSIVKYTHDCINVKLIYFVLILNNGYNMSVNDSNVTQQIKFYRMKTISSIYD